jgi:hypothetical protein
MNKILGDKKLPDDIIRLIGSYNLKHYDKPHMVKIIEDERQIRQQLNELKSEIKGYYVIDMNISHGELYDFVDLPIIRRLKKWISIHYIIIDNNYHKNIGYRSGITHTTNVCFATHTNLVNKSPTRHLMISEDRYNNTIRYKLYDTGELFM